MMTTIDDASVFLRLPYIVAKRQQRLQFVAIRDRHRSFIDAAFCFPPAVKLFVELFFRRATATRRHQTMLHTPQQPPAEEALYRGHITWMCCRPRTIATKRHHAVRRRHPMPPPNDNAPLPCPDAPPKQHCTPEIYWDDVCLTWHT